MPKFKDGGSNHYKIKGLQGSFSSPTIAGVGYGYSPLSPRIPDVHYESANEQFPDVIGPTPPPAEDDEPISNESLPTGDGWEIVTAGIAVQRPHRACSASTVPLQSVARPQSPSLFSHVSESTAAEGDRATSGDDLPEVDPPHQGVSQDEAAAMPEHDEIVHQAADQPDASTIPREAAAPHCRARASLALVDQLSPTPSGFASHVSRRFFP